MLVLLCAATVGQIEDVDKLRENYEKAQAHYEKVQALCNRTQQMYADILKRESQTSGIDLLPAMSTNPRLRAMRERIATQRAEFERTRERMIQDHRRRFAESMRRMEVLLRQLKQRVDALRWQYELAVGRPSEHFASRSSSRQSARSIFC